VTTLLDDLLARVTAMTPEEQAKAFADAQAVIQAHGLRGNWTTNPGPQTDAFFSLADLLLYGGAGGGGKTALLAGLATSAHERSLLIRRQFNSLSGLIEELLKVNGGRDGFRESPHPRLRTADGRQVELGACLNLGDEEAYQGRARDLLGVDEAAQFEEQQIRFLMGWNRTTTKGQRVRTVLASNPPVGVSGEYLIKMFRPWLDITHPRPAKAGELRWYVTNAGDDIEVDGPDPVQFPGMDRPLYPKSRTFIPAKTGDNPYITADYQRELDAMEEPWRSAIRDGNFMAARSDQEGQIIPTAWVQAAQARWKPLPPQGMPMTSIGVDIAQGGKDKTVLSPRYDWWFGPLECHPGASTPSGREVVGLVVGLCRDKATIVIDMGGGYGGETYSLLSDNVDLRRLVRFKGAEASDLRTRDRTYGFTNCRTAALWMFREALDPEQEHGSPIQLPPDQELLADLCAATFRITPRGIEAESADKVKEKLGRSPDKGVAVLMSWWAGAKFPHMVGNLGNIRGALPKFATTGKGNGGKKPYGFR
jgi:hypothetical protein